MWLAILSFAWAAPALTVSGTCPGPVTFTLTGATPGRPLVWVSSPTAAPDVIPAGVCAGTAVGLDLGAAQVRGVTPVRPDGSRIIQATLPEAVCGHYVQVLDRATCTMSDVVQVPAQPRVWENRLSFRADGAYSVIGVDELADGRIVVASADGSAWYALLDPTDGVALLASQIPEILTANGVDATADGGFLLAGERARVAGDPTVVRLDPWGAILGVWSYDLGYGEQGFYAVRETADGGFVAAGIFHVGADVNGAVRWSSLRVGGGGNANALASTADGGLLTTGEGSSGTPAADYNHVVSRSRPDGNLAWNRAFGGPGYEWGAGVAEADDGGAAMAGWTRVSGVPSCDLVRLDPNGAIQWAGAWSGVTASRCRGLVAGGPGWVTTGIFDDRILLLGIADDGSTAWARTYGEGEGFDVVAVDDGFVIAARGRDGYARVIKTDPEGRTGCEVDVDPLATSLVFAEAANTADFPMSPTMSPVPATIAVTSPTVTPECQ